jgi:hypothetical protein
MSLREEKVRACAGPVRIEIPPIRIIERAMFFQNLRVQII